MDDKEKYMRAALAEARKGFEKGECPIGCVIVKDGKILVRSHNLKLAKNNCIWHAEVVAIDKACKKLKDWRLTDCDMYVTLEPCTMCSGTIVQARIRKVYFGAYEPKSGAVVSNNDIFDVKNGHNHKVEFEGGILEEECGELMKEFFRNLRLRSSQTPRNGQDTDI